MMFMATKLKSQKKVRIGGTVDQDVSRWLMKTKGREKFSAHLNKVLRKAMESESGIKEIKGEKLQVPGKEASLENIKDTMENIIARIKGLQNRVESLEAGKPEAAPETAPEVPAVTEKPKRGRGRPRKEEPIEKQGRQREEQKASAYNVKNDINWFMAHDRYNKVKPDALVKSLDVVLERFDQGENITVASFKDDYDLSRMGVPYPTFRLFYFPLIRDRLLEKKVIKKVEKAGKKGVYRKR